MKIETFSAEETYKIGEQMGREAKAGDVLCLLGDLGVGKTVFTQGFAAGLGITEPVSSPTFTIVQTYDEGRIPFYHFDVYRIGDVEEMEEIGFDEYIFGEGVCLIEWANLIEEILPPHYQTVRIEKVLERENKLSDVIKVLDLEIDISQRTVRKNGVEILLKPKEFELLRVLAKNKNIAISREKLLSMVWGYEYMGETRTVDVHIGQLRKKLDLSDNIKTVSKMGYRLED